MRRVSELVSLSLGLILALGFGFTTAAKASPPSAVPQAANPAQSSPAPEAQPQHPVPEQTQSQSNSVDDILQLTPDQKEKIAAVVNDENRQMADVQADASLTPEQKQQKALEIRQAAVPKMKALLTPEQLQKLAALAEQRKREQNTPQTPEPASPQR
jgi:Spy/CpxP family protein refolding chaperone